MSRAMSRLLFVVAFLCGARVLPAQTFPTDDPILKRIWAIQRLGIVDAGVCIPTKFAANRSAEDCLVSGDPFESCLGGELARVVRDGPLGRP